MTLAAEILCVMAIALGLWLVGRDIANNFKKRGRPRV
jgi:hypothetical protein